MPNIAATDAGATADGESAASQKTDLDLAAALGDRWKAYRAQRKLCQRGFSEEAVHDVRVAARRLLTVLEIIRPIHSRTRVQKIRRALKKQLDALDDLRDVQVMAREIAQVLPKLPELESFQGHLQERERLLMHTASRQMRNSKPSKQRKRIRRIRAALEGLSEPHVYELQASKGADQAFARATEACGHLDGSETASIHRLRIAFKTFRYMVEVIVPLLPDCPPSYFGLMHAYQGKMGAVQDADVLIKSLADFAKGRPQAAELQRFPLDSWESLRYYEARKAELTRTYLKDKADLLSFWRAAPDQPFPWETQNVPLHHPSRDR